MVIDTSHISIGHQEDFFEMSSIKKNMNNEFDLNLAEGTLRLAEGRNGVKRLLNLRRLV